MNNLGRIAAAILMGVCVAPALANKPTTATTSASGSSEKGGVRLAVSVELFPKAVDGRGHKGRT